MSIFTASATEIQNNFGKYINRIMDGDEIIISVLA